MIKLFIQNRNFRSMTFFTTFGGIGRGMFSIFMMWAIHAMYQNPMYTGIAGFMFGAPLVVSFIVGPFVDRWDKVKVLRAVEFTKFCVVTLMLLSHLFLDLGPWFFFLAILVFSGATMFGGPAATAMLPRIVDGEDLVKANVLMNILGIIGGVGLGAILLTMSAGELNFTQFYGVIAALLLIASLFTLFFRYKEPAALASETNKTALKVYLSELWEGFVFVKKGAMLFFTIAVVSMNFFARVAYVNFPMLAETHLGSASGYMLLSFLALTGGLVGSYICRVVENKFKLWVILAASFVFAGVARILFVNIISDNLARAILMYVIYVGLSTAIGIFYQVLIQKLPPKNLISRVDTITTSLAFTTAAIGALAGGLLGTILYVNTVFFIQGGAYIAIGVLVCFSKHIRALPKISELGKFDNSILPKM